MAEPLQFAFLSERPDAIPVVAGWYFEEWGRLLGDDSIERSRERLDAYLDSDAMPFILLAISGDEPVGAAQLKIREMAETFPDREHWIGGLYVAAPHRGLGFGSLIVERLATIARGYGVRTLNLQTEATDGGLYARLGWKPCARAKNHGLDVLVMERRL